jgi:ubiquinone/menaquinone biosynthesis C-methylase UbiE
MEHLDTCAAVGNRSLGHVDASGPTAHQTAYLHRATTRAEQRRLRCFERLWLQPCAVALDAGSGIGDAAVVLAGLVGPYGRAVGIERSTHLVDRARQRAKDVANVEYRVGDLASLPFDDGTFDAAYSEHAFVHLDDPEAAMRELHRVLRPGGRLVFVDADHSRSAIDADDDELSELLIARLDPRVGNVRSGRRLRSQAVLAGFVDVDVEAEARIVTDRDEYHAMARHPITTRLAEVVADGIIEPERADVFLADQDTRATHGRFQVTIVSYVVAAVKPAALPTEEAGEPPSAPHHVPHASRPSSTGSAPPETTAGAPGWHSIG